MSLFSIWKCPNCYDNPCTCGQPRAQEPQKVEVTVRVIHEGPTKPTQPPPGNQQSPRLTPSERPFLGRP